MPSIKELVDDLGKDQETAWKARQQLERIAMHATAPGEEAEKKRIAAELAVLLNARAVKDDGSKGDIIYSSAVRRDICYALLHVSGADEVPALEEVMDKWDIREAARAALDRNPSGEAIDVLIEALSEGIGPDFRVGVLGSLARRKGPAVLDAVLAAAEDEDNAVRMSAIDLLPEFADADADPVLIKATQADCTRCQSRAWRARVRLAASLCEHGKKDEAKRILKGVVSGDAPAAQKFAAEKMLKDMPRSGS